MGKNCTFITDSIFYCMQCGNCGLPIVRNKNKLKEAFHRKKLYCRFCKQEVNHIECRNKQEVEMFLEDFKSGVYVNEAKASVDYIGGCRKW